MLKKHTFAIVTVILSLFLFSCSTLKTIEGNKKIDTQLVGIWGGEEKGQQVDGAFKKWRMTRVNDGIYSIEFFMQKGDYKQESVETGKWWVEDNLFYEYNNESRKTTIYKYKTVDKNSIDFTMTDSQLEFNNTNYTFTDKRIMEDKSPKEKGVTTDTAIKVNSVSEEYQYLKTHYPGAQFIKQALINQPNGNSFDKITFKTKDGVIKSLYFDITSFFGKGL